MKANNRAYSAPNNAAIAAILDEVGDLLAVQKANPFRVRAYHACAETLRNLDQPAWQLFQRGGRAALESLPNTGKRLAAAIDEILHTGELHLLQRLRGRVCAEDLFATIPGIGEELAHRVRKGLHIETLEELEAAAHNGSLEAIPGFGPERIKAVREYLASTLSRRAAWRGQQLKRHRPPSVGLLLDLDDEYRRLATAHRLHQIAPSRFNPSGQAWLPVWHPERDGWHFTVLYSNSARAHQLGKTRDWVVLYFESDGDEDQCTVVTEFHGPLTGLRVVRGRERECAEYYRRHREPDKLRAWAHDVVDGLD